MPSRADIFAASAAALAISLPMTHPLPAEAEGGPRAGGHPYPDHLDYLAVAEPTADQRALQASLDEPEEDRLWQDITLRLDGVFVNEHPKLSDKLELYLGRAPGADWGGEDARSRWRGYVMGYSALFDPRDTSRRGTQHLYCWQDAEAVILAVEEPDKNRVTLTIAGVANDDPWISGGTFHLKINLVREGDAFSGRYEGSFERHAGPPVAKGLVPGRVEISGDVAGAIRPTLWPAGVPVVERFEPGEHPRLMFRKVDLPALKQRLETPEGKALFARLEKFARDPDGDHTRHGYALGMMYQLTGDKAWADQAARWAQGTIDGTVKHGKWGWYTTEGGYMRVGLSVAATAVAYDLCYDAWEPAFRASVAKAIQDRLYPGLVFRHDLRETDGQLNPRANHYLLWNGGAGLATLAIKGDPGTDDRITRRADRLYRQRLKRGLVDGFGDRGWFYEGTFCGRFPTNLVATQYFQALRVAAGHDYVADCDEANWLVTKWIYEVVRVDGKLTHFPREQYAKFGWDHFVGDFGQGFAIIPEAHRASVLRFYQTTIEPGETKHFDAHSPMSAAYALVNWPIGLEPQDPGPALGYTLYDTEANFFLFRSGWAGDGDIVVSMKQQGVIQTDGIQGSMPGFPDRAVITHYQAKPDKTTTVTGYGENADGTAGDTGRAIAVDFSGVSGCEALFVAVDLKPILDAAADGVAQAPIAKDVPAWAKPKKPADLSRRLSRTIATLGGRTYTLQFIHEGELPQVTIAGQGAEARLVIGGRTIAFDGQQLVLGRDE